MKYHFEDTIAQFTREVTSIHNVSPVSMLIVGAACETTSKQMERIQEKHADGKEADKDGTIHLRFKNAKHATLFQKKVAQLSEFNTAYHLLPRTLLMALISAFDAYVARLVRGFFYTKPDALKSSEKTIGFSELISFGSFKEATEHVVETEVSDLLRENHAKQFRWLEKKLGIPLTQGLDVWSDFIEITERRNLFAHSDGIVSRQYIRVCDEHGCKFQKKPKLGESLNVSPEYFDGAFRVLMEIGLKLGQVIWRKLLTAEHNEADRSLNNQCVDLIARGEYELASKILSFALQEFTRRSTQEMRLYYQFNLAQAYKWMGKKRDCENLLQSIPVTTLNHQYRLAAAVLRDDFEEACNVMRQLGKGSDVTPFEYYQWPLFKEFRGTKGFAQTYEAVFGEPFLVTTGGSEEGTSDERLGLAATEVAQNGSDSSLKAERISEDAQIIREAAAKQQGRTGE